MLDDRQKNEVLALKEILLSILMLDQRLKRQSGSWEKVPMYCNPSLQIRMGSSSSARADRTDVQSGRGQNANSLCDQRDHKCIAFSSAMHAGLVSKARR